MARYLNCPAKVSNEGEVKTPLIGVQDMTHAKAGTSRVVGRTPIAKRLVIVDESQWKYQSIVWGDISTFRSGLLLWAFWEILCQSMGVHSGNDT